MSSLNQVNLIGNLGSDPKVLKSSEQGDFVRLSLATSKKYRTKEGKVQGDIQWHTVYLSNGLGKLASKHLKKGDKVFVSGELRTREWQNKKGEKLYSTAIYVRDLRFLNEKLKKKNEDHPDSIESEAYGKAMEQIRDALDDHYHAAN